MIKRQRIYNKFNGKCAYTGTDLEEDWQIDHIEPQYKYKWKIAEGNPNEESNLVPCQRIINHYKRGMNLEQFREYIKTLHIRLKKLPKKTKVYRTAQRIIYLNKVAELFGITVEKPFEGTFYFETL